SCASSCYVNGVTESLGRVVLAGPGEWHLFDEEIVLARPSALSCGDHPARHAATPGPGIFRVLWIAVFHRNRPLAPTRLAEELANVKSMLLGNRAHLLAQCGPRRILLARLYAADLQLQCRQLRIAHLLKAFWSGHGSLLVVFTLAATIL